MAGPVSGPGFFPPLPDSLHQSISERLRPDIEPLLPAIASASLTLPEL